LLAIRPGTIVPSPWDIPVGATRTVAPQPEWIRDWNITSHHGSETARDVQALLELHRIIPENWDAWIASRPESDNVEDRRTPEQIAWDNRVRQKLPPLVQFPPYEEPKKRGPR
jgi:hypothetical protein